LKNKSYFKTSTGDEAGCAAKKGVITSKIKGKVYFQAWSMDVKFEGKNVDRHLDLTTNNHASMPGDTPPWVYTDSQYLKDVPEECHEDFEKAREACRDEQGPKPPDRCDESCQKAQACVLVKKKNDKKQCCAPHNTGHHLVPEHCCKGVLPGYDGNEAPTVCAGGWSWHRNDGSDIPDDAKTHPQLHEIQDPIERKVLRVVNKLVELGKLPGATKGRPWKYRTVRNIGVSAHSKVFKSSGCNKKCIGAQLDSFHDPDGSNSDTYLNAKEYGNKISKSDKSYQKYKQKFPELKPAQGD
jgi:hypothetical protein